MLRPRFEKLKIANVAGAGGKEREIVECFEDLVVTSQELYDAVDEHGNKYEFKKQNDTQYFDTGKYGNLSEEEEKIWMVFIQHEKGLVNNVQKIRLGELLKSLGDNKEFAELGWSEEAIQMDYELKQRYPKKQLKTRLAVKKFLKDYDGELISVFKREWGDLGEIY